MRINDVVIDEIKKFLRRPETGGILGVDGSNIVTKFYPDSTGVTTKAQYIPDVNKLNEIIREWATEGIAFAGFVHTHPKGAERLSSCDVNYAKRIKEICALSEILMLLYLPEEEKFFQYIL